MPIMFQGFSLEFILLLGSCLLVLSVFASRISSIIGIPVLLIFLGLGMLAGSEGLGGIPFEDHPVAFAVGSVCLTFILFDGGLRTSWSGVRPILPVGISLSFFGTVITGIATGVFAHYALGLGWQGGLLLGAIVSSTDAVAVFSILRSKGLCLEGNLKQILEFEAGSNDPVAIFLTTVMILLISSKSIGIFSIIILFLKQAGLGLALGYFGAKIIRFLIDHAGIEFEGLYGVLLVGLVLILFSTTSYIGGSGFFAVYVAGIMLGRVNFRHKRSTTRFIDGISWISQIAIFIVLGLLVFPSKVMLVWKEGLVLAMFMMFVARPISVLIATPGKLLDRQQRLFVSWVGLRGAAPIILATLPWSIGLPNAEYYFNLVFFVVIISVISQGVSIPWVAAKLKVTAPFKDDHSTNDNELGSLLPPGFILIEATVSSDATASNKRIVEIGLPSSVILTSVMRDNRLLIPQGDTILLTGDKIRGHARKSTLVTLKKIFGHIKKIDGETHN